MYKIPKAFVLCVLPMYLSAFVHTSALEKLKAAYPDHIKEIHENSIILANGTCMQLGISHASQPIHEWIDAPSLLDQLEQPEYHVGKPTDSPTQDPGRIRYEPLFYAMYGNSPEEVIQHLDLVAWMPNIFGNQTHLLLVTKVNNVHKKIQNISDELEQLLCLKPEYIMYLQNPGGTYRWRTIAHTKRLSSHSFGIALDINTHQSSYWLWDLKKEHLQITENTALTYHNNIPWEIVQIFEKHGFIWGGKWYHYDTMHFEYRPELLPPTA